MIILQQPNRIRTASLIFLSGHSYNAPPHWLFGKIQGNRWTLFYSLHWDHQGNLSKKKKKKEIWYFICGPKIQSFPRLLKIFLPAIHIYSLLCLLHKTIYQTSKDEDYIHPPRNASLNLRRNKCTMIEAMSAVHHSGPDHTSLLSICNVLSLNRVVLWVYNTHRISKNVLYLIDKFSIDFTCWNIFGYIGLTKIHY